MFKPPSSKIMEEYLKPNSHLCPVGVHYISQSSPAEYLRYLSEPAPTIAEEKSAVGGNEDAEDRLSILTLKRSEAIISTRPPSSPSDPCCQSDSLETSCESPAELKDDITPTEIAVADYNSQAFLCRCRCRNCTACPFRGINNRAPKRERKDLEPCSQKGRSTTAVDLPRQRRSPLAPVKCAWSGIVSVVVNLCQLKAEDSPGRFKYDSSVIPEHPLPHTTQRLLEVTEMPFMILWVYFTYWVVIVCMTAGSQAPSTIWLSAAVAAILVGIGLNANAYRSVTVPRRRGSVRYHRHLELKKYGESIDSVEMKLDWGMITRFFIIPFGVSSLSGLTNSNRERFLLVFPNDPFYLGVSVVCPVIVVVLLATFRVMLLWSLRVRWSFQVLFLNGALVD